MDIYHTFSVFLICFVCFYFFSSGIWVSKYSSCQKYLSSFSLVKQRIEGEERIGTIMLKMLPGSKQFRSHNSIFLYLVLSYQYNLLSNLPSKLQTYYGSS